MSTRAAGDGIVVVTVRGEIDLQTVPSLRTALREALGDTVRLVVVDLEHVRFMASAGLAELLAALRRARGRGAELRLAAGGRPVRVPMELTGAGRLFEHYPSVDDAVRQPLVRT